MILTHFQFIGTSCSFSLVIILFSYSIAVKGFGSLNWHCKWERCGYMQKSTICPKLYVSGWSFEKKSTMSVTFSWKEFWMRSKELRSLSMSRDKSLLFRLSYISVKTAQNQTKVMNLIKFVAHCDQCFSVCQLPTQNTIIKTHEHKYTCVWQIFQASRVINHVWWLKWVSLNTITAKEKKIKHSRGCAGFNYTKKRETQVW